MDFELPDGTTLSLADGATGADAAAAIGPGLARAALAIKVDGELRDLARPLPDGDGTGPAKLEIVTERSGDDALELIRHDAAHVLAAAVMELYPGVKISIGPPIEDGFYYDFDFPDGVTLSDADFERIEAKMREHIDADEPFVREDVQHGRRARALPRRGPGLQGRADRRPRVRDHGRATRSRCTPTARSPTCAAGRTPRAPSASRRSSSSRSPARTGAGTPASRCSRACTGRRSSRPRTSTSYLERLERARANDHRRLGPAARPVHVLRGRRRAPRSGCRPAPRCSTRWSR